MQLHPRRWVAGGVLGDEGQHFTVDLCRRQCHHETAVSGDDNLAYQIALAVEHRHARPDFGCADQLGAAAVDGRHHCFRGRDVQCGQGADRRDVLGSIGQGHLQALAIELRGLQGDGEGACGAHHTRADLCRAHEHPHGGAHFADATEGVAGRIEPQLGRRCWRRQVWRLHRDRLADVAGWVGLQHGKHLVIDLSRRQVHTEAAVGQDRARAQRHARCIPDGYR